MQKFTYYASMEIVFGRDEETRAVELAKHYGGSHVSVVYGGGPAAKSGLFDHMRGVLHAAGITFSASGDMVPNPLAPTTRRMVEEVRAFRADSILTIGDGSVVDTAKAVADIVTAPGSDVWKLWIRRKVEIALSIDVILMIPATDSKTSNSTVLTNDTLPQHTRRGTNANLSHPRLVTLNPEPTVALPKRQIGAGAVDIFIYTVERYFALTLGGHLAGEIVGGLFRDIVHFGPLAVRDPKDYEAMSELMWHGSISHVGLAGVGAKGDTAREGGWACHQLGMALSVIGDYTHGAALATVLPAWARYVEDANPSRLARFAEKVYGIKEGMEKVRIEAGVQVTEHHSRPLGIPVVLTELPGHTSERRELETFALERSYRKTHSIGGFKVSGYEDIPNIYENAIWERSCETAETVLEFREFIHQVLKGVANEVIHRDDVGRAFRIEEGVEEQV